MGGDGSTDTALGDRGAVNGNGRIENEKPQLSLDTLNLLAVVLSQQSVSAGQENFDEAAAALGKARRELLAVLGAESKPEPVESV